MKTTKQCRRPNCRAWSWELAAGKPCPYCLQVDRVERAWVWFYRLAVVGALGSLAALAYQVAS